MDDLNDVLGWNVEVFGVSEIKGMVWTLSKVLLVLPPREKPYRLAVVMEKTILFNSNGRLVLFIELMSH